MAWEVGAARTDMTMELIYLMPGELNPELAETFRQPHLLVNPLGERFMNEEIMPNSAFTGNAISMAILFNAKVINRLGKVDDGSSTSDYDPAEQKRNISISLSMLPYECRKRRLTSSILRVTPTSSVRSSLAYVSVKGLSFWYVLPPALKSVRSKCGVTRKRPVCRA